MRLVNALLIFVAAPFIGAFVVFSGFDVQARDMVCVLSGVNMSVEAAEQQMLNITQGTDVFGLTAKEQNRIYQEQEKTAGELAGKSQQQKTMSDQLYEERILAMLGPPVEVHSSRRVEIKVFKLDELGYRGYIAKVKLHDPKAMQVTLAPGGLGEKETTGEAVKRTGAILGINGSGFYTVVRNGRELAYPLANTVIDGKFIGGFHPSDECFFAGIDRSGNMIGGTFTDEKSLARLNPWQGVSFLPVLIRGGKPMKVPDKWQTTKQPRTIIGEYANGDLILIVVDGRQNDWSSGVTLERLQEKLAELGVKEGFNLDGGGSSTFIFGGRALNRPSDGKQRPVPTNIVIMP